MTVSQQTGGLLVSGSLRIDGKMQCGVFDVDPNLGTVRTLWLGAFPDCGGPISPAGRMLHSIGKQLDVIDLGSGSVQTILKAKSGTAKTPSGAWSPDGRWISVADNGRLLLIDANDSSRRRSLGKTANGPGI